MPTYRHAADGMPPLPLAPTSEPVLEVVELPTDLPGDGEIARRETWRVDDRRSRIDGPTVVDYFLDGTVAREVWWLSGKKHRLDGPADVKFHPDGALAREEWWGSNLRNRKDGPAIRAFASNGALVEEHYFQNGYKHRVDGPQNRLFTDEGELTKERFYLYGRPVKGGFSGIGAHLGGLTPNALLAELGNSSYRELLGEGVEGAKIVDVLLHGVGTIESIREVLAGAPPEWVRAFEESRS